MLHRASVCSARVIKALTVVAALAAMLVLTPRPALAATYDVNNTSEGYNAGWCTGVGSTCNLRTAVQKANASPGHDLINIAGGTYTLSNGALFINEGVTLKGAGTGPGGTFLQNAASQATATDRVVYISAGAGVDTSYTVQDLTIQNGKTDEGGGMAFVANGIGQLTISNVVIQNNRATLNGGGLLVATGSGMAPTVTITNSQILNNVNEAGQGGGLLVGWNTPVNISGTTISGNKSGEGLASPDPDQNTKNYKFGEGAGIYMYVLDTGGASTISGSTITNNYAYHDYEDVTFGGSGGGIKTGRGLTITNTVISNNNAQLDGGGIHGSFIGDDNLSLTNVTFSGNHADRDGGGILYVLTTAVPFGGSTNIGPVGTINGGQFTNNTAGGNGGGIYSRVHDNGTSVAPSVTMSSFSVTNNTAAGHGGGIYHDNYVTNAHTVTTLTQSNLTITGNHGNKGGGQYINGEINYSLTGTNTMSSNVATGQGGGLYISTNGTVGLSNLTANTNQAVDGGGIYHNVTTAATTINNMQANNNTTSGKGGGIYLSGSSPLTLTQITASNNNATGDGGGMYVSSTGSVSMTNVTANSNHGANGGGIYHAASTGATTTTATIDTLQVNNNTASGAGGAINLSGNRNVTMTTVSPITLNTAAGDGGGLWVGTTGTLTMNSLELSNNQGRDGGGAYYSSGTITHNSLYVHNNIATRNGGGLAIAGGTLTTTTANLLNNTASQNGGGVLATGGGITFKASLIASNSATGNGGGLYTSAGSHSLTNVTISTNQAQGTGGGLQNAGASFTATNTTVANNQATTGGGLYLSSGTTTIHNTIVGTNLDRAATPAANDVKGSVNLAAASSFNLIGPGGAGGLTNGSNSNKIAANLAEVGLEPLANYGGLVQTHKLKSTSLAQDGGDNTKISEPYDARGAGFTRKLDAGDADLVDTVDIGSYEAHPAVSHIADVRVLQGSVASKDLTFYVGDVDNVVNTPVVSIVSNTSGVLGSAVLQSYSGGTGTVRVTFNAGAYGQATVRVRVDDPDYNGGHFMEDIFLVDVVPPPDLQITKEPSDTLRQGDTGKQYKLKVTNVGAGDSLLPGDPLWPAVPKITVTDTFPAGLTPKGFSGTNWTCDPFTGQTATCYYNAVLAKSGGSSVLTLNLDVAWDAGTPLSNSATVSGGGDQTNSSVNDSVAVTQTPDLVVVKTHGGDFKQGETGKDFTITVTNLGPGTTDQMPYTVTDTLPAGLSYVGCSGTGWSCTYNSTTRVVTGTGTTVLAPGESSALTLTVNVDRDAATGGSHQLTNKATTAGGGELSQRNTNNTSPDDVVNITQMPDLEITKTAGNFYRNQQGAYTITVANTGFATTSGTVTVEDVLNANLTYVSGTDTTWTCTYDDTSRKVSCTTNAGVTAAAGANFPAITMTVGVSSTSPLTLANTATVKDGGQVWVDSHDSSTVSHSVSDMSDLKIVKSAVGTNWTQGDTGREFSLQVTNQGAGPTVGTVTVTDVLDDAYTYAGFTGTDWSCPVAPIPGQTVACTYTKQVSAGASFPLLTLQVDVSTGAPPTVANTATVAGGNDSGATPADNQSTISTSIIQLPDLKITKSDGGLSFQQGQADAVYTITVENIGTGQASLPITVTDVLDGDLTFVSATGTGWTCSYDTVARTVSCSATGPIAIGGTSTITLTVLVNRAATTGTDVLSNTAAVSVTGDTDPTNDSSTDTTTVEAMPDLEITKTAGNFYRNQPGTYTITVANTGFATTSGTVTVEDVLDTNLTYVSGTGTGWTCTYDVPSRKVSCTTNAGVTADPTESFADITITVGVAANSPLTLANTATVKDGGQVWVDSHDSSTVNHSVYDMSDLKIVKSAVGTNWTQGDTGREFSLQVTNQGAGPTFGTVTVTDVLDDAYTYAGFTGTDWSCPVAPIPGQTVTCTYTKQVSAGASFPLLTLQVDVSGTAPPTVANTATVAGGNDSGATPADNQSAISTSIIQRPDLKVTKSDGGLNFRQGQKNAVYTITVENIGTGVTEHPVTLTDVLDGDLSLVGAESADWNCSETGGTVTCEPKAPIAAGSTSTITITVEVARDAASGTDVLANTATVSVVGDINAANDASTETTTVEAMPDLEITKTAGNFYRNQPGTYTITVANTGFATTSGTVTVEDVLDTNLTYVSGTGTGWTCSYDVPTRKVTCTTNAGVTAAASASFQPITLTVGVSSTSPLTLANTATVSGGGQIWVDSQDSSTVNHSVYDMSDLKIVKSAVGTNWTQGDTGREFSLQVTNQGAGPTFGTVTVTDVLDDAYTYAGFTGTDWSCPVAPIPGQTVTCTYTKQVSAGASFPLLTLQVDVAGTAPPTVANTATVAGGNDSGATPADNQSAISTSIIQRPDLKVTKSDGGLSFQQGQKNAVYTITVENIGTGVTEHPVTLTDVLDGDLSLVSVESADWNCSETGGTVTCEPKAPIAAGSTSTITITVNVARDAASGTDVLSNTATVSVAGDINSTNDASTETTTVQAMPDLEITKTAGSFRQGRQAAYTITVSNTGFATTSGAVTVEDVLDANLTYVSATDTNWTCTYDDTSRKVSCTTNAGVTAAAGANFPAITLTVGVSATAPVSLINTATAQGGGQIWIDNRDSASVTHGVIQVANLVVEKTHTDKFTQGDTGRTFTIIVGNTGTGPTDDTVTVTDTLPAGFTDPVMDGGTNWNCVGLTCTTSVVLAPGHSYDPITLTVNVAPTAPSSQINTVQVSGGGEAITGDDTDTDTVSIIQLANLRIFKTHSAPFHLGFRNLPYYLTVTNFGQGATAGTVTVTDTLPPQLSARAIAGQGWTCQLATLTCTRSDSLGGLASYPPITVMVDVVTHNTGIVINQATVSGGGEVITTDNTANDPTQILPQTPPPPKALTISVPVTLTREDSIEVSGTTYPNGTVQVGSKSVKADQKGNWSTVVPLVEGPNVITASAGDVSDFVTVVRDSTPPAITLAASAAVTTADTVLLTAISEPGATVEIEGKDGITLQVKLKKGVNTFTAIAMDPAGNTATASVTVARVEPEQASREVEPGSPLDLVLQFWALHMPAQTVTEPVLLTLQIPGTSEATQRAERVATLISVTEIEAVTQDGNTPVHQLEKPVTLTFSYDPALVPDPGKLRIFYYDPAAKAWVALESTVDPVNHTVTARTDHFSLYAALAATQTVPTLDALPATVSQAALQVTGKGEPGSAVSVLVNGAAAASGTVDNAGKFSLSVILAAGENRIQAITSGGALATGEALVTYQFRLTDVDGHWANKAIGEMVGLGVVKGYEDGTFRPENQVTRAEFAVMLGRLLKLPAGTRALTFTDANQIPEWARPSVGALVEAGIAITQPDGSFGPNVPATRAEMAVMLARALRYSGHSLSTASRQFTDSDQIPAWATELVSAAANAGLINGYPDGSFKPGNPASRAEAVTMFARLRKILSE